MRRVLVRPVARSIGTRLKSAFVKSPAAGSDMGAVGAVAAVVKDGSQMRSGSGYDVTPQTWRSGFDESLDQLRQSRSWGRSRLVFDSMSALPGDLVPAQWRAAAAHNAGCASLRLGQHEEAVKYFERALHLRSGETSDAFAAVSAVSNLGIGVCLLAQHALVSEAAPAVITTATDHLLAAHEAATRSAGGDTPSAAEALQRFAAVRTTTSYYAALSLLCALSSSRSDGRVGARAAHACVESVRLLLGTNARSSLGAERACQLLEDVDAMHGPLMSGAVAEALAAGDDGRPVLWPRLTIGRAHFGVVVPLIALHADGTPIIEILARRADGSNGGAMLRDTVAVCTDDTQRSEHRPTKQPVSATPYLTGSPFASPEALGQMLRECCVGQSKPLLAVTGSGLSRACGLPTRQELWSSDAFERDLDVTAWGKSDHPDRLWRLVHYFYKQVDFAPLPTHGHWSLDKMVDHVPGGAVVTQNVDGLHSAEVVHEVHGSLLRFRCDHCGDVQSTVTVEETSEGGQPSGGRVDGISAIEFYKTYVPKLLDRSGAVRYHTVCNSCRTEGHIRPDVVLFGEAARIPAPVIASKKAEAAFGAVLVVGTAGDVYPSSAIAQHVAQRCSCPVAVVDPAMTRLMDGSRCDMAVRGSAEQVLGEVATEYLRGTT